MMATIEANWLIYAGLAVIALLIAWWLYARASSAPKRRDYKPDVLSEGAEPAQRNQALIDAPPAAQIVTPAPHGGVMAGVAEIVAVTAQDEVEEVEARAAEMEVVPEVEAAPAPVAAGDDLSKIKGLGPKLQKLLPELGLTTYAQIAALTDADLDALDAKLGAFAGRPRRDAWVDQAKLLASGDVGGFEGKFGKL
ncbi:MAG: hypothetical protein RL702_275 [Pseudomonadota bacterium]|jgi:predicted flap endonuclease-1-like 5' DNA nuclease|nr:hypothetical protein [Novosphingobium sp.]HQE00496.1 hypothetical protein [Novosphingobium sp.]